MAQAPHGAQTNDRQAERGSTAATSRRQHTVVKSNKPGDGDSTTPHAAAPQKLTRGTRVKHSLSSQPTERPASSGRRGRDLSAATRAARTPTHDASRGENVPAQPQREISHGTPVQQISHSPGLSEQPTAPPPGDTPVDTRRHDEATMRSDEDAAQASVQDRSQQQQQQQHPLFTQQPQQQEQQQQPLFTQQPPQTQGTPSYKDVLVDAMLQEATMRSDEAAQAFVRDDSHQQQQQQHQHFAQLPVSHGTPIQQISQSPGPASTYSPMHDDAPSDPARAPDTGRDAPTPVADAPNEAAAGGADYAMTRDTAHTSPLHPAARIDDTSGSGRQHHGSADKLTAHDANPWMPTEPGHATAELAPVDVDEATEKVSVKAAANTTKLTGAQQQSSEHFAKYKLNRERQRARGWRGRSIRVGSPAITRPITLKLERKQDAAAEPQSAPIVHVPDLPVNTSNSTQDQHTRLALIQSPPKVVSTAGGMHSSRGHPGMLSSEFVKGERVLYLAGNGASEMAQVIKVHWDDGPPPFYSIRMLTSGYEKQTDAEHLSKTGRSDGGTGCQRTVADGFSGGLGSSDGGTGCRRTAADGFRGGIGSSDGGTGCQRTVADGFRSGLGSMVGSSNALHTRGGSDGGTGCQRKVGFSNELRTRDGSDGGTGYQRMLGSSDGFQYDSHGLPHANPDTHTRHDQLSASRIYGRDQFVKEPALDEFVSLASTDSDDRDRSKHRISAGYGRNSFNTLINGLIQTTNGKAILEYSSWASYTMQSRELSDQLERLSAVMDDQAHGLAAFDGSMVDNLRASAPPNTHIGEQPDQRYWDLDRDLREADPMELSELLRTRVFTGAVDVPSVRQAQIAQDQSPNEWPPIMPIGASESPDGRRAILSEMLKFLGTDTGKAYVAVTLMPTIVTQLTSPDLKPSSPWYYNSMTFQQWQQMDTYMAGRVTTMFDLESINGVPHSFYPLMLSVTRQQRNTHKLATVLAIARHFLAPERPQADMFVAAISRFQNARYDDRQPLHHFIDYLRELQVVNHEHYRSMSPTERTHFIRITDAMILSSVQQALLNLVSDGKPEPADAYAKDIHRVAKVVAARIVGKRLTDEQKLILARCTTTTDIRQLSVEFHHERCGNSSATRPAKWYVKRDDPGGKPPLAPTHAMIHNDDDDEEDRSDEKPPSLRQNPEPAPVVADDDLVEMRSLDGQRVMYVKSSALDRPARAGDQGYFTQPSLYPRQAQQQQSQSRQMRSRQTQPHLQQSRRVTFDQQQHRQSHWQSQKPMYRPMSSHSQGDSRPTGGTPQGEPATRRDDTSRRDNFAPAETRRQTNGAVTHLQADIAKVTQDLRDLVRAKDPANTQKGSVAILTALERLCPHQLSQTADTSPDSEDDDFDTAAEAYERSRYASEEQLFRHCESIEHDITEQQFTITASLHPDDDNSTSESVEGAMERMHSSVAPHATTFKTWADSGATNTVFTDNVKHALDMLVTLPYTVIIQTGSGVEGTQLAGVTTMVQRTPAPDGRHPCFLVGGIVTPCSKGLNNKILLSERKLRSSGFDIIAPSSYELAQQPTIVASIFDGGDHPIILHTVNGMQEADLVPLRMMPAGIRLSSLLDGSDFDAETAMRHFLHCARLSSDKMLMAFDKAFALATPASFLDCAAPPQHVAVASSTPRYTQIHSVNPLIPVLKRRASASNATEHPPMNKASPPSPEADNTGERLTAGQQHATNDGDVTGEHTSRTRGYMRVAMDRLQSLFRNLCNGTQREQSHGHERTDNEPPVDMTDGSRGSDADVAREPEQLAAAVTAAGNIVDSDKHAVRKSQAAKWASGKGWRPIRNIALCVLTLCSGLATCGQVFGYAGVPIKYIGGCEINSRLRQRAKDIYGGLSESDVRQLYRDIVSGAVTLPDNIDVCEGTATCQTRCSLRYMQPIAEKHQRTHGLFFMQMKVIMLAQPKYIVLEITPPDAQNITDYRRVERSMRKGGYEAFTLNRMPSALCGDRTCRHRYVCVGVRNDINDTAGINLSEYLSDVDEIQHMREMLDDPMDVPDRLWLGDSEFVPKPDDFPRFRLPELNEVVDYSTWGASTYADLVGWYGGYGKGRRVYSVDACMPTFTSFGNVLIHDDRVEPASVRYLTVREMARASNFDEELVNFLQSLPEQEAVTYIANAVPIGLLSTVYAAVHDHAATSWLSEKRREPTDHNRNSSETTSIEWMEAGEKLRAMPARVTEPAATTPQTAARIPSASSWSHTNHDPPQADDGPPPTESDAPAEPGEPPTWGHVLGRERTRAKASWSRLAKHGSSEFDNAVDRITHLHRVTGHAPADRLEKIIACGGTNCKPGDSRYLPPCQTCMTGGFDHVRRHHKTPSTTREEMLRKYLPGEYWIFDVCEMPVYSVHGQFRYVFGATCPVSNFMVSYYASDLSTSTYVDFLKYLNDVSCQRCGRRVVTVYHDDFSTFHEHFDVAQAKSELNISSVTTPPYMHWLNTVAEIQFRWKVRTCRILLQQLVGARVRNVVIKDPQGYWPHAWDHAVDVYNVSPSSVNLRLYGHAYTPEQLFLNVPEKTTDWTDMHPFGDTVWYTVENADGKLSPTAKKGYYMGRPSFSKLYAPLTDMPHGYAVLTEENDIVRLTGKLRFASDMRTRVTRTVGIVDDTSPGAGGAANDTRASEDQKSKHSDDGDVRPPDDGNDDPGVIPDPTVDVRPTIGTAVDTSAQGPQFVTRTGELRQAGEPTDADNCVNASAPDAVRHNTGTTDGGSDVVDAGATNKARVMPSGAASALPPPAILRHKDLRIMFRAGKTKDPVKNPYWDKYSKATTTREFFDFGGTAADWRYDLQHGHVWFVDEHMQQLADLTKRPTRKSPTPQSVVGVKPSKASVCMQKAAYAEVLGMTVTGDDDMRDVWQMADLYDENTSRTRVTRTVDIVNDTSPGDGGAANGTRATHDDQKSEQSDDGNARPPDDGKDDPGIIPDPATDMNPAIGTAVDTSTQGPQFVTRTGELRQAGEPADADSRVNAGTFNAVRHGTGTTDDRSDAVDAAPTDKARVVPSGAASALPPPAILLADFFTKGLPTEAFTRFKRVIMNILA